MGVISTAPVYDPAATRISFTSFAIHHSPFRLKEPINHPIFLHDMLVHQQCWIAGVGK